MWGLLDTSSGSLISTLENGEKGDGCNHPTASSYTAYRCRRRAGVAPGAHPRSAGLYGHTLLFSRLRADSSVDDEVAGNAVLTPLG